MSHLVAKILLSLTVWPLGALVYLITFVVVIETRLFGGFRRDESAFLVAGLVTTVFVASYWTLLWSRSVRWTGERVGMTVGAAIGAVFAALVLGGMMGGLIGREFGYFIGGITAPTFWLFATIFVWRETKGERAARLARGASDRPALVCPTCGYNLTGLSEARCPECGGRFTLDELIASQKQPTLEE